MRSTALLAFSLAMAFAVPANAAIITRAYNFTGTNIQDVIGSTPSPFSSVSLSFTATFDTNTQILSSVGPATLNGTNLPLGSAFAFSFIPSNNNRMSVGGAANGTFGVAVFNDDFSLDFRNALSDTPEFTLFVFTTAATSGSAFRAFSGNITSTAVPEPASWALMIAGFGAIGSAMRRRKPILAKGPLAPA